MMDNLSMGIVELLLYTFCDLCHKENSVCSPGGCEGGPMDSVVAVNSLAVCVLTYGPDECPGLLSRFKGVVWISVLHVCRQGSSLLSSSIRC